MPTLAVCPANLIILPPLAGAIVGASVLRGLADLGDHQEGIELIDTYRRNSM